MWDKSNEEPMDPEKVAKLTQMVVELGVPEDKVDEHLLRLVKKASFKLKLLRLKLDEKGVDETQAKQIVEKLAANVNEKDLAAIKEWHEKHQADKQS